MPRRMLDNRQADPTAPAPITPILTEHTSGYTLALERVMQSTIPYRTLGRTGERVSAIGLGGWHLGLERVDEPLSLRIIRTAIDRGINFLDNCWDYNDGASEIRMGKALRDGYRQKVFLMTKIAGRNETAAATQINESLRRARTRARSLGHIQDRTL